MKDFIYNLITFVFFATAMIVFYLAVVIHFPVVLINLILIAFAIFVLLQGCDRVDKKNKLGKYNNNQVP